MHLYPDAQSTLIAHNVIDGTGRGESSSEVKATRPRTATWLFRTLSATRAAAISAPTGAAASAAAMWLDATACGAQGDDVSEQSGFVAKDNVVADPLFVDKTKHNFRLRVNSPCLHVVGYDTAALLASLS